MVSPSGGGVRRREMLWIPTPPLVSTIALGSKQFHAQLNAAALALRPFTVVRTRGYMFLKSDQAANTENQFITFGVIVVTDVASGIGVTAIPGPVTDPESDFFVYESLAAAIQVVSAASVFSIGVGKELDSRSMRKVDNGDDIVLMSETPATGISEGVEFRLTQRMLVKLH